LGAGGRRFESGRPDWSYPGPLQRARGLARRHLAAVRFGRTDRSKLRRLTGMARNRFQNLEPERREEILAAAGEEFAERGYGAASLARIIEKAGISKGSLYYYFNDKEDLFTTSVQVAVERLMAGVEARAAGDLEQETYWEAMRDVGIRTMELMAQGAWYVRLARAFRSMRDEPEARGAIQPMLETVREATRGYLRRGQTLGLVRKDLPLDLLAVMVLAMDEAAERWLVDHGDAFDPDTLASVVDARIDVMRDMLDAQHEGWDR
jgi:AcrR family transcriptional regulator